MILIASFAIPSTSFAQNRVKRPATRKATVNRNKRPSSTPQKGTGDASISFSCPLLGILIDGDASKANNMICHFKMYDFGEEGKTVMVDLPELAKQINVEKQVYSWSGNIKLVPAKQEGGLDGYVIMRGNYACGGLIKTNDGWMLMLQSGERDHLVSDLYPGMNLTQVENKMKEELGRCQFKQTGKSGGFTIYTLYWLDMQKSYHWDGDYHYKVSNDKAYARFFFDSNSKLHKWIIYY